MTSNGKKPDTGRNTQLLESVTGLTLDGWGIDDDEHLFRRLTGSRGEHLPPYQQEKMFAVAKYIFRTNMVGQRFITLMSDFVAGEEVSLSFRNREVREVIERHWNNPYNDWDRFGAELFESYTVTGELLLPLFPDSTGLMTVGAAQVENIKAVRTDPQNWRIVTQVEMKPGNVTEDGIVYDIVNIREQRDDLDGVENPALFYGRLNPFGERGMSILYSVADYLDLLDQFAFSEVERWMLQKAFIFDVTINGADEAEIAKKAKDPKYANPPKPSSVVLHNENETWEVKNPRLESADTTNALRFIRNHIGGGLGIPEHWYAEGGDVNRAVGTVMAEPARRRLKRLQTEWRDVLGDVLKAQIDYAVMAGTLQEMVTKEDSEGNPTDEMISVYEAYEINMPDISASDTNEIAEGFQLAVSSLAVAVEEELLSTETARKLVVLLVQMFGLEIDMEEERQRLTAEEKKRDLERPDTPQGQRPPVPFMVRDEEREVAGD